MTLHIDATPQQKAALLAWWLAHGEPMTIEHIAELLYGRCCMVREAGRLLRALRQVVPIAEDERAGLWARIAGEIQEPFSREQRAAVLAWAFVVYGGELSVQRAAELTGLRRRGAHKLLTFLSNVLPIYDNNDAPNVWTWRVCSDAVVDDWPDDPPTFVPCDVC